MSDALPPPPAPEMVVAAGPEAVHSVSVGPAPAPPFLAPAAPPREPWKPGAWVWKALTTITLLASFWMASLKDPLRLWLEGWGGILAVFSMLLGLSWGKDLGHRWIDTQQAKIAGGAAPKETSP